MAGPGRLGCTGRMIAAPSRLWLVRSLHTVIYVVMAIATFVVLYAGVTGATGPWLGVALGLLAIETVLFVASGMKCPLTAIVARYAGDAPVSDTWFPQRCTRHTLMVFGPLMAIGVILVAARAWL